MKKYNINARKEKGWKKTKKKTKNSIKKYEIKIFIKLILYYKPKNKTNKKENHKLISIWNNRMKKNHQHSKKAFLNPKNILIFTPQNFFRYFGEKNRFIKNPFKQKNNWILIIVGIFFCAKKYWNITQKNTQK